MNIMNFDYLILFKNVIHTEDVSRAMLFSRDDCDLFDVSFKLDVFENELVLSKEQ